MRSGQKQMNKQLWPLLKETQTTAMKVLRLISGSNDSVWAGNRCETYALPVNLDQSSAQ